MKLTVTMALLVIAGMILSCGSNILEAGAGPNILIIFTDNLGYGDLVGYGNQIIKTPLLDRLATEGTLFTGFYAQPVCWPARSALLTGRYPEHI
jgi:arylsulfatase A-like enzyme